MAQASHSHVSLAHVSEGLFPDVLLVPVKVHATPVALRQAVPKN